MLKWLKDELVQQLVAEVRRNGKRYETIINMLRAQEKALADIGLMNSRLEIMHGLIFDLDRKVGTGMSELSDAVQSIKDDVTRIGDGVKAVLDKLQQPNPDVAGAVAALKEADTGLDAAADAMEAALKPAEPTP